MRASTASVLVLTAALLAACGGGNSPTASASSAEAPSAPAAAAAQGVTIAGTAATGAPLPFAEVSLKCQGASGSTTTDATGAFSVVVVGGSLPCMLRVPAAPVELYSVTAGVRGSTASTVTNVTPLTHMILALASGADPAAVFQNFNADSFTPETLATATETIASTLAASGIDIGTGSPLNTPFAVGDAADARLDALKAKLAAGGTTLAQLIAAISSKTAGLPAALLTPPAVGACPQFRNLTYDMVFSTGRRLQFRPDWNAGTATTLSEGVTGNGTVALTATPSCRFTYTGSDGASLAGTATPDGLMGVQDTVRRSIGIGLPHQPFTVADTVGAWSTVEYLLDRFTDVPDTYANFYSTLQFGADGVVTRTRCDEIGTQCVATSYAARVVADVAGDLSLSGVLGSDYEGGENVFAYKAPSGEKILIVPQSKGGILVARPTAAPDLLPAVGDIAAFSDLLTQRGVSGPISSFSRNTSTITGVDVATGGVTRTLGTNATPQTRFYNQPRNGMRYRAASNSFGAQIMLAPMAGKLAVYGGAYPNQFFGVSIND